MKDETVIIPQKGNLVVPMTNDYLFKMLMQENNKVLKALVQDLLHLEEGSLKTITITNPIQLGDHVDDKTIMLDIKALMNDRSVVNLEMQVINKGNWPERSLYYLCDAYQNLNKGDDYINVKPVYHIGILDFTLFPEVPELYATYRMTNEKNHHIYSRNLQLSVLDLTQTDLATEEDYKYHIDIWARLFKSTKWEELHMLSTELPVIDDVSKTVYRVTAEERARMELFARQDKIRCENDQRILQERAKKEHEKTLAELIDARIMLSDTKTKLSDTKTKLSDAETKLSDTETKLSDAETKLSDAETKLSEAEAEIARLKRLLKEEQ